MITSICVVLEYQQIIFSALQDARILLAPS